MFYRICLHCSQVEPAGDIHSSNKPGAIVYEFHESDLTCSVCGISGNVVVPPEEVSPPVDGETFAVIVSCGDGLPEVVGYVVE